MDERSLPLTEQNNPSTADLDLLGTADLLHRINDEDRRAAWAVEREIDVIATAVDEIARRIGGGGKLHYFGAGTSGRIGVLDAAEIPPTFSVHDTVIAHIAGGPGAVTRSIEGAEDDAAEGRRHASESGLSASDATIFVSASGSAPYVLGALEAAKAAGALTIGMTSSPGSPLEREADMTIVLRTGPEVIAGSTRMKAGTAQKMALTMMSTAVMVKLGKVYGNLMVDLHASNDKLRERALRLARAVSGAPPVAARAALVESGYRVPVAIVMLRHGCDAAQAQRRLAQAGGDLRTGLAGPPVPAEESGRQRPNRRP